MAELTLDLTNLCYTFAERNAGRGLVWLLDHLGHSGVAVTKRYLRNVLNLDTGEMQREIDRKNSTGARFR